MQRSIWVAAGLMLLLISGCGPSDDAPDPSGSTVPADSGAEMGGDATSAVADDSSLGDDASLGDTGSSADGTPITSGVEESQPDSGAEGDAAAPVDEQPPIGVLRASDPAAVALGAGTPQLVEFFAFW